MPSKIRVIDFFCGAGGFSEGFRQQGFDVVMGIDNWRPAVQTHNLNHHLSDTPFDVLSFENDIAGINLLPDTEVIIGSPPCVDFSMSNKAGKAQKGLGIRLIEAYLRVVAVKKHQKGSILKAWLMENVPNSRNFVRDQYTFMDLNLTEWARKRWPKAKSPEKKIALLVKQNGDILNAANYGSPQARKRFVCGEIVSTGEFPLPKQTHDIKGSNSLQRYVWLSDVKNRLPSPIKEPNQKVVDPNYSNLKLAAADLTDHFYDTGLYEMEWEKSKFLKINHPYMGKMSFPEDEERPSRTIMATRSGSTRESIVYKSEYGRSGDGEYRLPTVREAASLMGFPISYQFRGSEVTKWRLIGNAVCPHLAFALAGQIRQKAFSRRPIPREKISFSALDGNQFLVENLNNWKPKDFAKPPRRSEGAKFRRHPFKNGNMTVALTNYHPHHVDPGPAVGLRWFAAAFIGAGESYQVILLEDEISNSLENLIKRKLPKLDNLSNRFMTDLLPKVGSGQRLQELFETNAKSTQQLLNPSDVVNEIERFIVENTEESFFFENVSLNGYLKPKMPIRQLMAASMLSKVVKKINV